MNVTVAFTAVTTSDGETQTSSFETDGTLDCREGKIVLRYCEPETEARTVITAAGSAVSVARRGETSSLLRLETGVRRPCRLTTPYGTLTPELYTAALENALTPTGGTLCFSYTLGFAGTSESRHRIEILVKEV